MSQISINHITFRSESQEIANTYSAICGRHTAKGNVNEKELN